MKRLILALCALVLYVTPTSAAAVVPESVNICPLTRTVYVGQRVHLCYALFAHDVPLKNPAVQFVSNQGRFVSSTGPWQSGQWNAVSFRWAAPLRAGRCAQADITFVPNHRGRTVVIALLEPDAAHPDVVTEQSVMVFNVN